MSSVKLPEEFDLTGKVAIVTGAASGIGRCIALKLAKFGADVVVADFALEHATKVGEEIRKLGRRALVVKTDVTKKTDTDEMAQKALKTFGKIDILVNNAGILRVGKAKLVEGGAKGFQMETVGEISEDEWDRLYAVNVKGVLLSTQAVMKSMKERKTGKIVNIGSSMSSRASVTNNIWGGPHYNSSKAAVQCITRQTAWELAPYKVNVNAIAPGVIETPMHTEYLEWLAKKTVPEVPLARLGTADDIACATLFLVSEASKYVTGQTIHVNGGQIMID